MLASDQRGHRRVGAHVRVDGVFVPQPANGPLDVSAAVVSADFLNQRGHPRVVGREDLGGPEGLGVAPVGAGLLPARREVVQAGPSPGRVEVRPVELQFAQQLFGLVGFAQRAGSVGGAPQAAEVPDVVTHDVVFGVPEVFSVGRGDRQHTRKRRVGRCLAPGLHRPVHGPAHLWVDSLEPGPVAGDLVELPQCPDGLAVGVELVLLRLEAAVRPLMAEVELQGLSGRVHQAGLFQLHHLVGSVADVKLVVESFATVKLAVIANQQLAHMRGPQSLSCLPAGHLDPGGLVHHCPPVIDGPLQPHLGVGIREGRSSAYRREGDPRHPSGTLAGCQRPGEGVVSGDGRPGLLDLHLGLGLLLPRVGCLDRDPVQEVLSLGGPVERLLPILDVGQGSSPKGKLVADRTIVGREQNDGHPTLQQHLGLLVAQQGQLTSEAQPHSRFVGQLELVLRRNPRAAQIVLQPDHAEGVAKVIERLVGQARTANRGEDYQRHDQAESREKP